MKDLVRELKKVRKERAVRKIIRIMDRHDIYTQDIIDYCVAELKKRKPVNTPVMPEINPGHSD